MIQNLLFNLQNFKQKIKNEILVENGLQFGIWKQTIEFYENLLSPNSYVFSFLR